jgi:hypothetical protein
VTLPSIWLPAEKREGRRHGNGILGPRRSPLDLVAAPRIVQQARSATGALPAVAHVFESYIASAAHRTDSGLGHTTFSLIRQLGHGQSFREQRPALRQKILVLSQSEAPTGQGVDGRHLDRQRVPAWLRGRHVCTLAMPDGNLPVTTAPYPYTPKRTVSGPSGSSNLKFNIEDSSTTISPLRTT